MKTRIAILVEVPTPYRDPLFERLAKSGEYEIQVLYCRDRQPDQQWQMGPLAYPARFLRNYAPSRWNGRRLIGAINPGVWRELQAFRPDAVVVYSYATATGLLVILWARCHRVPVLLRGDANGLDERGESPLTLRMKRLFLRWLTRNVSGLLSIGTLNSRYWLRHGARPERIFLARYAIDNEYFQAQAMRHRSSCGAIREQNGWRQPYLLLYVGRLVRVKRVDVLIEAVRRLSARRSDIALLIVGEGTERRSLEERAQALPQIFFLGFRDWRELPKYYGVADLFVLPSERESWGLVVNEAMASGLSVITTRKVGAAHDLVIEGGNGFSVPENDVETMASAIDRACQSRAYLQALCDRAQETISSWDYSATLAGFHRALAYCLDAKSRSKSPRVKESKAESSVAGATGLSAEN